MTMPLLRAGEEQEAGRGWGCGASVSVLSTRLWLYVSCSPVTADVVAGTTAGQDLNFSQDRLMSSRNFTNKLWNAGKFILFNLEQLDEEEWQGLAKANFATPDSLANLPLAEQWVVSALHQVSALQHCPRRMPKNVSFAGCWTLICNAMTAPASVPATKLLLDEC